MRKSDGSYISVLDHGRIVETPQYGRVFYVMFIDWEDIHIHYSDLIIQNQIVGVLGGILIACIVCEDDDGNYHRLIHEKTGFSCYDKYFWNPAPNSWRLKENSQGDSPFFNGYWEDKKQCSQKSCMVSTV